MCVCAQDETVNVRLPHFKVDGEARMEDAIGDGLGVTDLFPKKADLRLMTDKEDIVLSSISHKYVK